MKRTQNQPPAAWTTIGLFVLPGLFLFANSWNVSARDTLPALGLALCAALSIAGPGQACRPRLVGRSESMEMRMERPTGLKIALLVASMTSLLFLGACLSPQWKREPDVRAARAACSGLPEREQYACFESEAIARLNPDVCRLTGIAIDDACLQALYEAANDPAICDRIYLEGVVPNCLAWYAEPTPGVGLGRRWRPDGEAMAGCAPVTARDVADFVEVLAEEEYAFSQLCQRLGRPDWETGSGLRIYIYQLDDGSEVWLGFGRLVDLVYAVQVSSDGQHADLLSDR